jgi:hypothetical protein
VSILGSYADVTETMRSPDCRNNGGGGLQ